MQNHIEIHPGIFVFNDPAFCNKFHNGICHFFDYTENKCLLFWDEKNNKDKELNENPFNSVLKCDECKKAYEAAKNRSEERKVRSMALKAAKTLIDVDEWGRVTK